VGTNKSGLDAVPPFSQHLTYLCGDLCTTQFQNCNSRATRNFTTFSLCISFLTKKKTKNIPRTASNGQLYFYAYSKRIPFSKTNHLKPPFYKFSNIPIYFENVQSLLTGKNSPQTGTSGSWSLCKSLKITTKRNRLPI
jgi:hypothetical protein